MSNKGSTFGSVVRAERERRQIGLREMAKMIGVSPTYLSKVERNEFPPPVEAKVKVIAGILEQDPDELLALAGRVASDVSDIIKKHPREMATFLRTTSPETIKRLLEKRGAANFGAPDVDQSGHPDFCPISL